MMADAGGKVFVAGATGAIGRRLIPALLERGYRVSALARGPEAAEAVRGAGAVPYLGDALDRDQVVRAVSAASPDVVIHQLTALKAIGSYRNFDREFAATNELRTRGTDNLLTAAQQAGVRRFVAQSFGSWIYDPRESGLSAEDDRLDPDPPDNQRKSLQAIRHLEAAVTGAPGMEGVALRYGLFYGPGTSLGADGDVTKQVRKGWVPIIGDGGGVWSFLHVDDAVSATIAAMEGGSAGIYNVADDDPAPVAEWLPALAEALGARPPRRIPRWLGRLAAGEVGVSMFTRIRGMSNLKARRELGWEPGYPSWRDGFRSAVAVPE
jgi:nucleoside-diphosphate-sugar epimerase